MVGKRSPTSNCSVTGSAVRVTGPPDVVAEVTDEARRQLQLEPGVQVWVSIKASELQSFATA